VSNPRLGVQTRDHEDVDIVVDLDRLDDVLHAVAPLGFMLVEDRLPTRAVLRSPASRHVDLLPGPSTDRVGRKNIDRHDVVCARRATGPAMADTGRAISLACNLRGMRLPACRVARMGAAAADRWPSSGTGR